MLEQKSRRSKYEKYHFYIYYIISNIIIFYLLFKKKVQEEKEFFEVPTQDELEISSQLSTFEDMNLSKPLIKVN